MSNLFHKPLNLSEGESAMEANAVVLIGPDGRAFQVKEEKNLKSYHKPRLVVLGDLRGLTLGPSEGLGESGNPTFFKA
jgi:hypothetical protein